MKPHTLTSIILSVITIANVASAQTGVPYLMEMTSKKAKIISQANHVIERTYSDLIYRNDTTANNRFFSHYFSASNDYTLNAFAPYSQISGITVSITRSNNGKMTVVSRQSSVTNDVKFNFSPATSGTYYILVSGTLIDKNINSARFNLIIDRE